MSAQVDLDVHPLAFISTPHSPEFRQIRTELKKSLSQFGITALSVDDAPPGTNWSDYLSDLLLHLDFVILDLTGTNANVMFELGFARASRVPTIPILQLGPERLAAIPESVNGLYYLTYDPSNIADLGKNIRNWFVHRPSIISTR